jgi:hypothetical protein
MKTMIMSGILQRRRSSSTPMKTNCVSVSVLNLKSERGNDMAQIITPDGKTIEVKPKDGKKFSLEEMQVYVGGYIEHITLADGRHAYVNEEGKLRGLETNLLATQLYGSGDVICGTMLVMKKGCKLQ